MRPTPEQAVQLAGELGRLLDQVAHRGPGIRRLAKLVPDDYATHWQIDPGFPGHPDRPLAGHPRRPGLDGGALRAQPAARRASRALAERTRRPFRCWRPVRPASIPATARLLAVVAGLPQGPTGPARPRPADGSGQPRRPRPDPSAIRPLPSARPSWTSRPTQVALWPGTDSRPARLADQRGHAAGGDHRGLAASGNARSAGRPWPASPGSTARPARGGRRHRPDDARDAGEGGDAPPPWSPRIAIWPAGSPPNLRRYGYRNRQFGRPGPDPDAGRGLFGCSPPGWSPTTSPRMPPWRR